MSEMRPVKPTISSFVPVPTRKLRPAMLARETVPVEDVSDTWIKFVPASRSVTETVVPFKVEKTKGASAAINSVFVGRVFTGASL